jgi:replication factor C small subunit
LDPIQSRCVVFRFQLLEKKDIKRLVERISEREGLTIPSDGFDALYEASEGDCRRVINLLQATASVSTDITADLINTIVSKAKPSDVKIVLDYALAGDFTSSRDKLLEIMLKESISGTDIIKSIQKEIWNLGIDNFLKVKLTEKTGEIEFRLVEGSDEFIQLEALIAYFVLAGEGKVIENGEVRNLREERINGGY